MDEIVRRLRKFNHTEELKESMNLDYLLEKDGEDEDEEEVNPEETPDTESPEDAPVDEEVPEEDEPERNIPIPGFSDDEGEGEEEITPDNLGDATPEDNEHKNPLDNNYAVNFRLGQEVLLAYDDGTKSELGGTIEGYDAEGFYRIRWKNGKITEGFTDISIRDLVDNVGESLKCVCGNSEFINESNQIVCDCCGRVLKESSNPLELADKKRPKGKKLIRSEAHPISTAIKPEISESKEEVNDDEGYAILYSYEGDELSDYQSTVIVKATNAEEAINIARKNLPEGRNFQIDTTVGEKGYIPSITRWFSVNPRSNYKVFTDYPKNTIEDSIREIFKKKDIKEGIENMDEFYKLVELEGEFWTRIPEMVEDIEALGYKVPDYNSEYIIVSVNEDSDDEEYKELLVPIGGTARTMTLDLNRARAL